MNMLLMFLPILIILLLIVVIVALMVRLSRIRRVSPKNSRWLIIGYIIILLLAAILSYSILPENEEVVKTLSANELKQIESEQMKWMDAAHSGKLKDLEGVYTSKKSWSFTYDNPKLEITYLGDEASYVMVFVEERTKEDDVIEAVHYTGNLFIDGMDMTEKKSSAQLELKGNILSLKAPDLASLNITKFSKGFPFQQFSAKKNGMFSLERPSMGVGRDFILLKVPEGVEVNGHTNYVRAE
jgi:tRNA threonylcarbamoyladenosine modification (KEOPS) complex  Pcc1 subunit